MAAYAALLSLAETTHPNTTQRYESLFSSDAAEKVKSIHVYVISLLWFFQDFPEKVTRWEGKIRDVAYEIDNIIENLMWQQIQSRHRVMNPSCFQLEDRLQNGMEKLGLIAGEVTEERPTLSPASSSSSTLATFGNEKVIDLHSDVIMAIKYQLCGEPSDLQVIPIAGMGGIGKTTLARTLYNDQCILQHFDVRAWAVASQDYSPIRFKKNLFDSMIVPGKQMLGDEIDESEIVIKMFQTLKGRRYLFVIDDVWEKDVWDDVMAMFPNDNNGSRIMLTTRQLDVANYASSASHVHEMECMDESQSWDFLKRKVFKSSYCPPELEEVGRGIAARCGGLPLAIVLVAGVLYAANQSRATWEEITKNVIPIVGGNVEAILSLSYINLPHHLRSCFLFMGGFHKDVIAYTSRLIKLWAAEGFQKMEERCRKSLEEKAEEYLEELVKRNLVVVTSRKIDGKIKSCTLHDMVRDLCIRIAQKEKFLHVIIRRDFPGQGLVDVRRVSFSGSNVGTIWAPTLRTILSFQIQNVPSWLALLGTYNLLKELDALGVYLKELPSQVFELYHLRYLAVMGSFSIPSTVSNLVHLQTLIIHLSSGKLRASYTGVITYSLPMEIWKLPQLRHLLFHAPYVLPHPPEGLNLPLQYLQTLLLITDLVWNEMIIQLIPNVKRLGLTYTSDKEYHLHLLEHLHQLEKLEVIGYPGFSWRGKNPSFPTTLKKLTLVGGGFPWSDMVIIGSLPNLQVLKLLDNACDGEKWEATDESFPSLTYLLIDESKLLEWISESGSFPKLKHIVLRSCPFLKEIPQDIGDIPTLELIEVNYCTESLVESAKRIKQDQDDCGNDALQVRIRREGKMGMLQLGVDEDEDEDDGGIPSENSGEGDKYLNPQSICYSRRETERDMAAAAIDFVRETLIDLQKDLWHPINVPHIRNVIMDFSLFQEFLRVTVMNQKRDDAFTKVIVKEIHDVVYEVDDIIDIFVTKAIWRSKRRDIFSRFWSPSTTDILSIGKKVEAVKGRVEQCRQQMGIISLDEGEREKSEVRPPRKKDVVGFRDVTEDLISLLLQETYYFDVISIIGMLGLGKTTVAWKILNDPLISCKFPIRIWLPICQQFKDRDIFLDILKQVRTINDEVCAKSDHELADLVAYHLKGGRFLIVMDDVWSTFDWDRLRAALPDHNMKGKVLITSRHETVGKYASKPGRLYKLRLFTFEESWELFRLEALRELHCPPELENVGRKIASNCDGLPLAIIIIGDILATKFTPKNINGTKRDWEEVFPRVYSYINENDPAERIQKLISLSYDYLPYHLRACFLYLGMFPDDYEIPVSKLICMWIGEGFIREDDYSRYSYEETMICMEEIAHKYLEDLIHRNLVKRGKFKADGKITTCWIHPIIRDFCRREAANANFLQGITCNSDGQFVPSVSDIARHRRLFIHSDCSRFISLKPFGPRVRSFVCFPEHKYALSAKEGANLIRAFKLLRVLESSAFNFTRIGKGLYKLVHLRYIVLSSNLSILPSKFNKLQNLQTLIVDTTSRTLQVKADLWGMNSLRHFKTNASATLSRSTCGEYSNLQTLSLISVESCNWELSFYAQELKKLGIRGKLALLFDTRNRSFDSLRNMINLGKMKLINDAYPDLPSAGRLDCLPEPHRFPSSLTSLTLCATFLSWDHMSTLGLLEKLQVLKLKDKAFMGDTWDTVDGGFQCLHILHIEDTDLTVWNASSHHYPRLRGLELKNCEKLLQIPLQLAEIPTFHMLELHTCKTAAQSARQISDLKKQARYSEFLLSIFPLYDDQI